jgi:hypothetical protein
MRVSSTLLLACLSLVAALGARASDEPTNFSPPQLETKTPSALTVKESEVVVHGQRYRRIETQSEVYYLRLQADDGKTAPPPPLQSLNNTDTIQGARRDCLRSNLPMADDQARLAGEAHLTQITSVYVQALHDECSSFDPTKDVDAEAGLKLKTSKASDLRLGLEATRLQTAEVDPEPRNLSAPKQDRSISTIAPKMTFNVQF